MATVGSPGLLSVLLRSVKEPVVLPSATLIAKLDVGFDSKATAASPALFTAIRGGPTFKSFPVDRRVTFPRSTAEAPAARRASMMIGVPELLCVLPTTTAVPAPSTPMSGTSAAPGAAGSVGFGGYIGR